MYSSTELAKMFGTTKVTINRKFKDKSLAPFLVETRSKNNGKLGYMLKDEGLSHFQMLMAESKVVKTVTTKNEHVSESFPSSKIESYEDTKKEPLENINNDLQADYIQNLKEQIEFLKLDRERLLKQIDKKDEIIEKHTIMLDHSQRRLEQSQEKLLLLESSIDTKKKVWWKFWS